MNRSSSTPSSTLAARLLQPHVVGLDRSGQVDDQPLTRRVVFPTDAPCSRTHRRRMPPPRADRVHRSNARRSSSRPHHARPVARRPCGHDRRCRGRPRSACPRRPRPAVVGRHAPSRRSRRGSIPTAGPAGGSCRTRRRRPRRRGRGADRRARSRTTRPRARARCRRSTRPQRRRRAPPRLRRGARACAPARC